MKKLISKANNNNLFTDLLNTCVHVYLHIMQIYSEEGVAFYAEIALFGGALESPFRLNLLLLLLLFN